MPSKQTANYKLSQWVKTDRVLMEDFNADNLAIDAAIKAVDVRVDGKASSSSLSSLESTVNGLKTSKADASALSSLQSTVTALQNTVAQKQDAASAVKIAAGTYAGTGLSGSANPKTLNFSSTLGKVPELLIVRALNGAGNGLVLLRGMESTTMSLSGTSGTGTRVEVTWDPGAKSVSWYASSESSQFNSSGLTYFYFAIG